MKLEQYLAGLTPEKKMVLLGRDTQDPIHEAFTSKRVVHAGLVGAPIMPEEQQEAYRKAMQRTSDRTRRHAVYIHIPFCKTKCLYCGFYQNASRQEIEDVYMDALLAEIEAEAGSTQLKDTPIDCVFIGGGTPTSLSAANAAVLLQTIQESFTLTDRCEITLEGRIHDLVPEKIETWLKYGVNRISLGVQSFDTVLRQRIGRLDSREEVLQRLRLLKSYDVTVIVDLIYGLPGQSMEMWMEDVKTLVEADVDGMDLYQLNIFPGGALAKAVANGTVPRCADISEQADMYLAARNYLLGEGVERLSLCHWRRNKRECSCYNTLAKAGADVYAFGCGAGGHFGGISWMNQRLLAAYQTDVRDGNKPVMMAGYQVSPLLGQISDCIISDLEKGFIDFRRLLLLDSRLEDLEQVLSLWKERGLFQEDLGVYRLTKAGEFWYISLTQSLVECVQVLLEDAELPVDAMGAGSSGDVLDELLAELLPSSNREKREQLIKRIPTAVRMMLRHSGKEKIKAMLAGMPPAAREKMFGQMAK